MKRLFLINHFYRSLFFCLICFCSSAKADWVSVCQNSFKPAQAVVQKVYYKSNGEEFWLSLSQEKPVACDVAPISSVDKNFLWMGLLAKDVANALGDRPILHAIVENDHLKITEIIPQFQKKTKKPSLLQIVPINVNALRDFEYRYFGVEERVSIQKKLNSLNIQCAPGEKPAGALLKIDNTKLPDFPLLKVLLKYRADAGMKLGISDQARFDKGDPIILGDLDAKMKLIGQHFSVPAKISRDTQLHLSIVCPKQSSTLLIEDLRFQTAKKLQAVQGRGMWFWRPALWQQKSVELLKQAQKYKANRVFISIELDEESKEIIQKNQLVAFIGQAAENNIDVWVVEGDPRVVLPVDRARFVNRSQIFADFNMSQLDDLKLAGIQYDIEPYLVSGYALEVESWAQAYVDTISQLHEVANMPLEIVIPFWWNKQMLKNKSLLDHLVPYVESINIMNYRTSADLLERFAQPLLAWGERNKRRVSIALEVGPLAVEKQWRFNKASSGELWQIQVAEHDVLIYLDQAMFNPDLKVFKRVASRELSVDAVTFKAKYLELMHLLPNLEQSWENWSSFSGISLHGLDELQ